MDWQQDLVSPHGDELVKQEENHGTDEEVSPQWRLDKPSRSVKEHQDVGHDVKSGRGKEMWTPALCKL